MIQEINPGVAGMTIGYDRDFASEGIDPGLVEAIDQALGTLEQIGARVVDVKVPEGTKSTGDIWFPICAYEASRAHAENFPSRANEFGEYDRWFLEFGATVTDEQYAAASEQRAAFNEQFNSMFDGIDTVVCPAGGMTFSFDPKVQYGGKEELEPLFQAVQMYFTIPADFAGTPALTVPCGFSDAGIPYGLQFMGPRLSEPMLIRIGHAYEAATRWHQRHPEV